MKLFARFSNNFKHRDHIFDGSAKSSLEETNNRDGFSACAGATETFAQRNALSDAHKRTGAVNQEYTHFADTYLLGPTSVCDAQRTNTHLLEPCLANATPAQHVRQKQPGS